MPAGDGMPRTNPPTDDAVMNILLGMIRELKDDVKQLGMQLNEKFVDLASERRTEAEDSGKLRAEVDELKEKHRATRKLANVALGGIIVYFAVVLVRLMSSHPDVLGR
jgi:hypothetical protein